MKPSMLFVAAVLFAAAVPAQAVSHYWIDAVNGSDLNPGTRAQPFKSLTWAVGMNFADVHIHVLPGIYSPTTTGDFIDTATNSPRRLDLSNIQNLKITGVDTSTCILDFGAGNGIWGYIKIATGSIDVEISHLTMRNAGVDPWGNGAITVEAGAQTVDIHSCYFEQTYSTLIVWGGYDVAFHDNIVTDAVPNTGQWPSVGVRIRTGYYGSGFGDRTYLYNNTFYNIDQGIDWDGNPPNTQQWIVNNVTLACGKGFVDTSYPGAHVVVENNLAFSCTTWNYNPVIGPNGSAPQLSATNLEVDPMLANPAGGDYSLLPGSPCIDSGAVMALPYMLNDYLGNNRAVDSDENGIAIPDRGAIETTDLTLSVTNFGQGQLVNIDVQTTNPGSWAIGGLFMGFTTAPAYSAWWGMSGPDPLTAFSLVGIPGMQLQLPFPVDPSLNGVWVYMQFFGLKNPGTTMVIKGSGTAANVL